MIKGPLTANLLWKYATSAAITASPVVGPDGTELHISLLA